jgi:sialate O-acetylesterase
MDWSHDGQLYEFTFLKIAPFAVKTVIWYQGESNTHPPENTTELYKGMLRRLINIWRKDLMEEKLPFVVVQLANYLSGDKEGWPAVQKAQVEIPQEMEEVYSLISGDMCEDNDIHPPTKLPLAQRLAKLLEEIK